MTIADLAQRFPAIPWDKPLPVAWAAAQRDDAAWSRGSRVFACRVCVANFGLKRSSPHQWRTTEEAEQHIREVHHDV